MKTVTLSANTSWYLYNFRASTISALLQQGYRVICLSPQDDYSERLVRTLGCEWRRLKMKNSGINPFTDAYLAWQFYRYYRFLAPTAALHFTIKNNVYGTWAASLCSVPAINNVSGLGTGFIRRGVVAAVVRFLYRSSQPLAHRIFCQNDEDMALLIESRLVPAEKVELIPGSGVDLERFSPEKRRRHNGLPRFLYAGRMLEDKGLRELVEAIKSVNVEGQRCVLRLVGFADAKNVSAISEQQLLRWASDPAIEWMGPSDAMEDIYADIDCVVLPSYREGMPRSLLEAGAMGLPVVATDVPGCRNLVTHGHNGLLCEVGSAEALASSLNTIMAMTTEELNVMGQNERLHVERYYDQNLVVEATLRALDSVGSGVD